MVLINCEAPSLGGRRKDRGAWADILEVGSHPETGGAHREAAGRLKGGGARGVWRNAAETFPVDPGPHRGAHQTLELVAHRGATPLPLKQ